MDMSKLLTALALVSLLAPGALTPAEAAVTNDNTLTRDELIARGSTATQKAQSLLAQSDRLIAEGNAEEAIIVLNRIVSMELSRRAPRY